MIDSVRTKLTLWYVSVMALVLIAFSLGVYALTARKLHARLDSSLRTAMEGTARLFTHEKEENEPDKYSAQSSLRKYYYPRQAVALIDQNGQVLDERTLGETHAVLPRPMAELDRDGMQFFTLSEAQTGIDDGLRYAVLRVKTGPASATYIVICQPVADAADDLELLGQILLAAVPLALLLAAVGGWWLARRAFAPVVAMSEQARRIGAASLTQRLPVANPRDELGQLAATFNELLARLDAAFAQQRQFMADASHELRTPLSVLRTAAAVTLEQPQRTEAEYREALTLTHDQSRRLTRIVEEMFTLARADAGKRPLAAQDFYLDELVAETARAASVLAERKNITLQVAPTNETPFRGDEDLLRQLLLNLLDNAIKFTPVGGAIKLKLERNGDGHKLTVADNGCGIPTEAQQHIFERFYRVDKARSRGTEQEQGSGAGLGLSIASWIAEAHGGALRLAQSDQGGSTFVVNLPVHTAG